ncbi:MAG TPA: sialidase family protein, partial [Catenuloplanes sp.]
NRNSTLYYGAEGGNGLWRSTDSGVTWASVAGFPNVGNYAVDPADVGGYNGTNQGVLWVTFDETTGTRDEPTRTIYVGVADRENNVYRSTDAGATWQRIAGQPTGFIPHKGVLDARGGLLYLATSSTGGPYDGSDGQVSKLDTRTGAWTDITPDPAGAFGYTGLTIDRQHPGTIMVGSQISWWPDTVFFRSTDGGTTWTRAWDWAGYPNRTFRYRFDTTDSPWVDLGDKNPAPPDTAPKLGWMNESIEIDPFNSDRMMYGTGLTLYGTTDLTKWDTGGQATIRPTAKGLEETAVQDLMSPPTGAPLISGLGDIGGFRHNDLDAVPPAVFQQPRFTTTTSVDYAESNPAVMVRAGSFDKADRPNDMRAAFSTDGGANWFQGTEPPGVTGGGTIAANADGSRFVWSPEGAAPHHTVGFGNTWTGSQGLPAGARVQADRSDPNTFYGTSGGTFYVSTDGGARFTATAATGLPSSNHFAAVPGRPGDVWLAGSGGLFHSTDAGATFTRIPTVGRAGNIGFGKAAPGQTYPALYLVGTVDNVAGVYRSDNAGAGWVRINDDSHQYGNMGEAVTGDPRVYGRVYLGTNGRGILYADRLGGPSTPGPDP